MRKLQGSKKTILLFFILFKTYSMTKKIIMSLTVLFVAVSLSAQESAESIIRQMLNKLEAPHSYEITMHKRYSSDSEIRIAIIKKGAVSYSRIYYNSILQGEEIFTETECIRISHQDSTVTLMPPSFGPDDANLFLLNLDALNLGYTNLTDDTDRENKRLKIKIIPPGDENNNQPDADTIAFVIDATSLLPVSMILPRNEEVKFSDFRFGELDATDVNFDSQRYSDYKFKDWRNGSEWIEEADEPDENEEIATAADLEQGVDKPFEIVEVTESDPEALAAIDAMYDRLSQPHRYTGVLYYTSTDEEAGVSQEITHSGLGSPDLHQNRFHILTRYDNAVGREHFFDGQTYTLIDHRECLIRTSPYPPEQLAKDPMLVRDSSMICFGISPVIVDDGTMCQSITCFAQGDIHEPLIFTLSFDELIPVMIEPPSDDYTVRYGRVELGVHIDAETFKPSKRAFKKYIKKGYRIEEVDQE